MVEDVAIGCSELGPARPSVGDAVISSAFKAEALSVGSPALGNDSVVLSAALLASDSTDGAVTNVPTVDAAASCVAVWYTVDGAVAMRDEALSLSSSRLMPRNSPTTNESPTHLVAGALAEPRRARRRRPHSLSRHLRRISLRMRCSVPAPHSSSLPRAKRFSKHVALAGQEPHLHASETTGMHGLSPHPLAPLHQINRRMWKSRMTRTSGRRFALALQVEVDENE